MDETLLVILLILVGMVTAPLWVIVYHLRRIRYSLAVMAGTEATGTSSYEADFPHPYTEEDALREAIRRKDDPGAIQPTQD